MMIGQQMICSHKRRLLIRLFNFIINAKIDIIAFEAGTFAKKAKMSYPTLVCFENCINCPESSQNKDLAKPNNKQKCLINL